MKIEPFQMERWQSLHEHQVEINLSDSGVLPLSVRELVEDPAELEAVLDQRLIYTQTNGTEELRSAIAALYPGATPANVEAFNGGAEANFIAVWSLVEAGDEVVMMTPNYMQIWGLARGLGAVVKEWRLHPDLEAGRWIADLDELAELVTPRTRLIVLCNPDNPTGARLAADELDTICEIAGANDAWILADEIYRGSELDDRETPSVWGRTERVVITNSLSKTWGLPGLRLGWCVAPAALCDELWLHHDYTTISPGALSDFLGVRALRPDTRERLLRRARDLLRRNYAVTATWLEAHADTLSHIPPEAGAMLYLHYELDINSSELAERLRRDKSVLVVPGDHFGMDGWLRIGYGGETAEVEAGLGRIHQLLATLAGHSVST
jgi:aspartate/methionine/tyrosine aminotransferase